MIRFECDYEEGMHPKILDKLIKTNLEQTPGYGKDEYCIAAANKIKTMCNNQEADVHFLVGGTQTNMIVIDSILRPYQGVICADIGHINVHETGAVESTGHKVIAIESNNGKITGKQVRKVYEEHYNCEIREHTVQPGMVYITNPTEIGTIYKKEELEEISKACKECNLPLYMDGARLGYGLMSEDNDMILDDIARCCDVFYIGGTKIGAMFGEAVVITNKNLQKDFRYMIKRDGGLLAKGRMLGIQFDTLFTDNLYFEISKHAIDMAMKIKQAFINKGFEFKYDSNTNQQFPIIKNELLKKLEEKYVFDYWEKYDETSSVVRICTSWATKEEYVNELIEDLNKLVK